MDTIGETEGHELEAVSGAQKQRLFHIDFRLWFLGSVSRAHLVSRFGIKEAAATRDFALYREIAPRNLEYDLRAKLYRYNESFRPLFRHTARQVLTALAHGLGDQVVGESRPLIRCEAPIQLNHPNVEILAVLSRAIYQDKAVNVAYRSLSSGNTRRTIVPFALVDTGVRWHVRAYDRLRDRFGDFVITRIAEAALNSGPIEEHERRESDIQWNRIVEMEIVPHPNLEHPDTIAFDNGMEGGLLRVNVRAALAGYVLRIWNVDCSKDHRLNAIEHHLWLRNRLALYGVDNLSLAPGYESPE